MTYLGCLGALDSELLLLLQLAAPNLAAAAVEKGSVEVQSMAPQWVTALTSGIAYCWTTSALSGFRQPKGRTPAGSEEEQVAQVEKVGS